MRVALQTGCRRVTIMIDVGLTKAISTTVTDGDTAIAIGSGDVAVLGTPRVVALCEQAAVAVLAESLPRDATSVGTKISVDHVAASGVGATVTAKATVTGVEGKNVTFDVELTEGSAIAATGIHTRSVVNRIRFEEAVKERT
jgi:fluoroacetyl-CoA thioesterase